MTQCLRPSLSGKRGIESVGERDHSSSYDGSDSNNDSDDGDSDGDSDNVRDSRHENKEFARRHNATHALASTTTTIPRGAVQVLILSSRTRKTVARLKPRKRSSRSSFAPT
jgi:hypothetical protein